jgi:hypothetical protein
MRSILFGIAAAMILLMTACTSDGLVRDTEPETDFQHVPMQGPEIQSVEIESMSNGLASIQMVLEESGGVNLYFQSLESDLPPAHVGGRWLQDGSSVMIEFDEIDLYLGDLFCDYPACDNADELILSDDGTLRYRAFLENDSLHDTLYIWGIMCRANHRIAE